MLGIYCRTSRDQSVAGVATIIQQEELGVKFAKNNNYDYKVYKDEGKSGYKVDDEDNPFKDRPAFINLIEDIKSKIITDVWIIENSRLSRNSTTQAIIYRLFEKHQITLYENGRKYDLNNPTDKLTKQILDAVSEFERYEIVFRTSRGQASAFNKGKCRHGSMYGYIQENKLTIPNYEELENVKKIYDLYLNHNLSLRKIAEICLPEMSFKSQPTATSLIKRIISHHEYTSYSLNVEGRKLYHQFLDGEILSLQDFHNEEYWVKSAYYTEKIITIEDWIKANEKLNNIRNAISTKRNIAIKTRETDKSLASGLITCGYCHSPYYFKLDKGRTYTTDRYSHFGTVRSCEQIPKSITCEKIDTLIDIYFFIHVLIFDNSKRTRNELIEKSKIELNLSIDSIKETEEEIKKSENRIQKFNLALDETTEISEIKVIASQISKIEKNIEDLKSELTEKQIKNQELKEKIAELQRTKIDNPISIINNYFACRKNKDYRQARNLLLKARNPIIDIPEIGKDAITILGNNLIFMGYNGIILNLDSNYRILYPFINEFLSDKIEVDYNILEKNWLVSNQEKIKLFKIKADELLENKTEEKQLELLSILFEKVEIENRTSIFMNKVFTLENKDLYSNYYTSAEIADKLHKAKSSVREWGRNNGVIIAPRKNGQDICQLWTDELLEKYKSYLENLPKRKLTKTDKMMKHLQELNSNGKNQTETAKKKRSESMKKVWQIKKMKEN